MSKDKKGKDSKDILISDYFLRNKSKTGQKAEISQDSVGKCVNSADQRIDQSTKQSEQCTGDQSVSTEANANRTTGMANKQQATQKDLEAMEQRMMANFEKLLSAKLES